MFTDDTPLAAVHGREQSDEFNLAASDLAEERRWKNVTIGGTEYRIDASAVEPFRKVVTHGGTSFVTCTQHLYSRWDMF